MIIPASISRLHPEENHHRNLHLYEAERSCRYHPKEISILSTLLSQEINPEIFFQYFPLSLHLLLHISWNISLPAPNPPK